MAVTRPYPRLARLWQLPLLILSFGLFGAAAYLFINPRGGLSLDQKIGVARLYLKFNRPEAALDQLNTLIGTQKLPVQDEAQVHLLFAQSLDELQKVRHVSVAGNHERIIEQTRLALAQGAKGDAEVYRRLGESYQALGQVTDALESYRRAIAIDPRRFPHLQRKVIELQLTQSDSGPAEASLDEYLKDPKLADSERAWALQQKAQVLYKRGNFADAKAMLDESIRLSLDPTLQGEANYHLGYCMWRTGDSAEAERLLRLARGQLKVGQPLDADAAYLLGKIRQEQNDPKEAAAFYQAVLSSHPESAVSPLARLGRGQCRVILGEDAAGLADLHALVRQAGPDGTHDNYRQDVIAGIRQSAAVLAAQEKYDFALELLEDEHVLEPSPPADFFERAGSIYERRADQVEHTVADAPTAAEKIRRQQDVRRFRNLAADSYIAFSHALTVADDKAHAAAMWKGVDLYDRAGNLPMVISALELFAAERPEDGQTPDALLRLGRAYQAAGLFDKAVTAFERNQLRYPQSLAASKSGVPLAQAYIARGPQYHSRAENVLLAVLNNPVLSPDAEEFGQALFDLAQLYYRTSRYEEAVVRLQEMIQRYPEDPRKPQLHFLMADSYRKSAALLAPKIRSGQPAQAEALAARKERLQNAKKYYDRVVEQFGDSTPAADLDKLYQKLSYFYRADCLYDLGDYEAAIKDYDQAAMRYQDDASALSAYVQIVNAYVEMGRIPDAKRANERARTLLSHMPTEAFSDGSFSMPKDYWVRWLKWTNDAGLWNGLEDERQAAQRFANTNLGTPQ